MIVASGSMYFLISQIIADGVRKRARTDEEYLGAITPLLDGLYQFCQDQLANPAARAARPE